MERRDAVQRAAADVEVGPHARRLSHQPDHAVPTRGDQLECFGGQHRARRGRGDVHDGGRARHRQRFRKRADLQYDVQLRHEVDRQPDILAPDDLKSGEGVFERCRCRSGAGSAGTSPRSFVTAVTCCTCSAGLDAVDGDAGKDAAALVGDLTENTGLLLGAGGPAAQEDD